MNILGVSDWHGGHDSSAAIVCDGKLVAAVEEERFTRVKHDGAVPLRAIEFCLEFAGLRMRDVDVLAFAGRPFRSGVDSSFAEVDRQFIHRLVTEGTLRRRALVHKRALDAFLGTFKSSRLNIGMNPTAAEGFAVLREHFGELPAVRYFGHHACHAAASYLTSANDRAVVVTLDGRGALLSTVVWSGRGNELELMKAEPYTNSLGLYYGDCTAHLGLSEFGEGKTMGLAPYGDGSEFAAKTAAMLDISVKDRMYLYRSKPDARTTGFAPRTNEPILDAPYPNFAAAAQDRLQAAIARIVDSATVDTKSANVCLGGGVALNCSSNGALATSGRYESVTLFPACGDGGLSAGAALLCAAQAGNLQRRPLGHAYWGPEFSAEQCEAALRAEPRVRYRLADTPATEGARLLAAGNIIGWFQGRMEIGPRALGNRSILADPRSTAIRDRVNQRKGREAWRPLAPSVLAERAAEYFDPNVDSPFMLLATQVKPSKRSEVAGIVHVDGSARPQHVRRETNARYHDLISAFARETGTPIVLNTSFNAAGEPVVCSPQDAIRSFLRTELDALMLGDFLVERADKAE